MRFPIVCLWRRTSLLFLVVVGSILFAGMWFGLAGSTPVASATRAVDTGLAWESLGGPVVTGGQGNAIAVNPAAAGEVYVALIPPGAEGGGPTTVYKTTDAAENWTPVFSTTMALHALAVRDNVVLAGGYVPVSGAVAYRSHDSGLHWSASFTLPMEGGWLGLSIHPTDTLTALAGAIDADTGVKRMRGQIYGTIDGGVSWTSLLQIVDAADNDVMVSAVLIHPLSPTIQFAAAATGGNTVIWRSANAGVDWTAVYTITDAFVRSMVAHPEQPNLLYAGAGNSAFGGSSSAVYRSEDAGLTWAKVHEPGTFVAVAPTATVVAVTPWGQTFRSTANGDPGSWTSTSGSDSAFALAVEYPPAVQVEPPTALSLTAATYYLGTGEWGSQKSVDAGDSWTNQNNGLYALMRPRSIAVNPSNPAHLFAAGGCDGGGYVSQDGGQHWAGVEGIAGCVGGFAFDPADPTIVYAADYDDSQGALMRSHDGGLNFTYVYTAPHIKTDHSGGGESLFVVASTPLSPALVYAGGVDYPAGQSGYAVILRSENRGLAWTLAYTVTNGTVQALAVDPADARRVWAGGDICDENGCRGFVVRTSDAGQTWTPSLATSNTVASLSFDRFTGALYAGDRDNNIRKSEDGGVGWNVVRTFNRQQGTRSGFLVVTDPYFADRVLLAGWGYVAESLDGGATWSEWDAPINQGTPLMEPGSLTIDLGRETQTIYAGFAGVWRYQRPGPSFVQLPGLTKQ